MPDTDVYTTPIVNKDFNGRRIDKFLSNCFPEISRSQIQRIISLGNVTCDDITVADSSHKVRAGEFFVLTMPKAVPAIPEPQEIPLEILYQDEDIVVVNKPAGMVVHPAVGTPDHTMVNALLYWCKDLSGIGGVLRPGIVHRIDKETSGILVVAKNDTAHKFLCEQFAEHSIDRTYYAFCFGVPDPEKGTIEGDIGRSRTDRKKMAIVTSGGKKAVTHYQVVENFKNACSLVKCNLETGRTHQIRVHLSSKGCGLIGDKTYGHSKKISVKGVSPEAKKIIEEFPRQALHAQSLGFIHPTTKEKMYFETPLPEDLESLLKVCKNL
ncbi:MAG: RluA family pseudouridine synthase [Alphaproteobacteria bacterium]|nr:RluA family pseudouridine synthase [Alphaproteobacteria bacterium]